MKITYNTDLELVKEIKKQLAANNGFCPCTTVQTQDTKCMCKEFRDMTEGTCRCGLYIKTK